VDILVPEPSDAYPAFKLIRRQTLFPGLNDFTPAGVVPLLDPSVLLQPCPNVQYD